MRTEDDSICEIVKLEGRIIDNEFYWCKPLLRPLSSMTRNDFNKMQPEFSIDILNAYAQPPTFKDKEWHVIILENRLATNTLKFNDGLVLLKNYFDLFNLIESGLALDKSKI